MNNVKEVLLMVDIQNTYYGAKNFEGKDYRIDYLKLKEFLEEQLELTYEGSLVTVDAYAYVVESANAKGSPLFLRLSDMGYYLSSVFETDSGEMLGSITSKMQMDLLNEGANYDGVMVVSGSGIFAPAFRSLRDNHPEVSRFIAAFESTLHSVYTTEQDVIDDILILDERVMRG